MKNTRHYTVFDGVGVPAKTFTMDTIATVTSAAHGLSNDDVVILTTATTLPAPLALLTEYQVINSTTNTFELSTNLGGTAITSTDAGTGAHTYTLQGRKIYCGDADFINITTYGNASFDGTLKIIGSTDEDIPNFGGALSATNKYQYVDAIYLYDASSIDGNTGFDPVESTVKQFSVNVDSLTWITLAVTTYAAGLVKAEAILYDKN